MAKTAIPGGATAAAAAACLPPLALLLLLLPRGAIGDVQQSAGGGADQQLRDLEHVACGGDATGSTCPFYGCPRLPRDALYDERAKNAVNLLSAVASGKANRDGTLVAADGGGDDGDKKEFKFPSFEEALGELASSGTDASATLTLIGFKGGPIEEQINQDRAFVISPFRVPSSAAANDDGIIMDKCVDRQLLQQSAPAVPRRQLLGVFDGHDKLGEKVSQYATEEVPKLVAAKLAALADAEVSDGGWTNDRRTEATKKLLSDVFIEVDANGRRELAIPSGGCTASVVLHMDDMLYAANAGDSRSIVAVYNTQTGTTRVVYATREDKPDLEDERARVEQSGGRVYIPKDPRESSRVFYLDANKQARGGLAMSRSLGDWDLESRGVIPDPIVDAMSISDIVAAELTNGSASKENSCQSDNDEAGGDAGEGTCVADTKKDEDIIRIVAISATDGVLDFISPHDIAQEIARSVFGSDRTADIGSEGSKEGGGSAKHLHVLALIAELMATSAQGWNKEMRGSYRDDMAISATMIK